MKQHHAFRIHKQHEQNHPKGAFLLSESRSLIGSILNPPHLEPTPPMGAMHLVKSVSLPAHHLGQRVASIKTANPNAIVVGVRPDADGQRLVDYVVCNLLTDACKLLLVHVVDPATPLPAALPETFEAAHESAANGSSALQGAAGHVNSAEGRKEQERKQWAVLTRQLSVEVSHLLTPHKKTCRSKKVEVEVRIIRGKVFEKTLLSEASCASCLVIGSSRDHKVTRKVAASSPGHYCCRHAPPSCSVLVVAPALDTIIMQSSSPLQKSLSSAALSLPPTHSDQFLKPPLSLMPPHPSLLQKSGSLISTPSSSTLSSLSPSSCNSSNSTSSRGTASSASDNSSSFNFFRLKRSATLSAASPAKVPSSSSLDPAVLSQTKTCAKGERHVSINRIQSLDSSLAAVQTLPQLPQLPRQRSRAVRGRRTEVGRGGRGVEAEELVGKERNGVEEEGDNFENNAEMNVGASVRQDCGGNELGGDNAGTMEEHANEMNVQKDGFGIMGRELQEAVRGEQRQLAQHTGQRASSFGSQRHAEATGSQMRSKWSSESPSSDDDDDDWHEDFERKDHQRGQMDRIDDDEDDVSEVVHLDLGQDEQMTSLEQQTDKEVRSEHRRGESEETRHELKVARVLFGEARSRDALSSDGVVVARHHAERRVAVDCSKGRSRDTAARFSPDGHGHGHGDGTLLRGTKPCLDSSMDDYPSTYVEAPLLRSLDELDTPLLLQDLLQLAAERVAARGDSSSRRFSSKENMNANPVSNHKAASDCSSAPLSNEPSATARFFSYAELEYVTNGFNKSNLIGRGGYANVYKGMLPGGHKVAVKELIRSSEEAEIEFLMEVGVACHVHHPNAISLLGYCADASHRLLVYDLMPNGSLDRCLHSRTRPVLPWERRTKIAVDAARGLDYLHSACPRRIVHRDVKTANILLGPQWEAKIADFGLARWFPQSSSSQLASVEGTFGYMAPEYFLRGQLNEKSDVFSFGIVLLEMISGRRPVDRKRAVKDESLVSWVIPLISAGHIASIVDPRLSATATSSNLTITINSSKIDAPSLHRMLLAALLCLRHSPLARPTMKEVTTLLEWDDLDDALVQDALKLVSSEGTDFVESPLHFTKGHN